MTANNWPGQTAEFAEQMAAASAPPRVPKAPTTEDWEQARDHADEDRHAQIRELLPRLNWHTLWEAEDNIEWLIHPIIPARALVALYSPAGIGKSLLMLEIAAALSCDREILGHKRGRRYRVLYIDFENDPIRDIRDRLQNMGYEPDQLDHLDYLSFPNIAHLDSALGASELLAAIEAYESEVAIIDTISRAVAGEENDNNTWNNFYRHTGLALKQRGVAMARLDHTGKDLTKDMRGGSAKAGDVDAAWKLTELKEGERFKLTNTKTRFRLDQREITILRHDNPLRHTLEDTSKKDEREIRIEALLKHLNQSGLPIKTGAPTFRTWLKGQGVTFWSEDLTEAVKRRKKPDLNPFLPGQNQPDLETDLTARSGAGQLPESEPKNLTETASVRFGQVPADGTDRAHHPIGVGSGQVAGQEAVSHKTCQTGGCNHPLWSQQSQQTGHCAKHWNAA